MGFTNKNLNIAIYNAHDADHDHLISEAEFESFVHDHDVVVKNLQSNTSDYSKMFAEIDANGDTGEFIKQVLVTVLQNIKINTKMSPR